MTKTRGAIYAVTVLALLVFAWFVAHRRDKKIDQAITSKILPPEDNAKVIVDPRHHTITTVTSKGITSTFLPKSGGSIDVRKDGGVIVTTRKLGTEISPYIAGGFASDVRLRAGLGLNLFYLQRWEIGPGLMLNNDIRDTRVYLGVTYNVYDAWIVGVAIDHKKTAYVMAGLKF